MSQAPCPLSPCNITPKFTTCSERWTCSVRWRPCLPCLGPNGRSRNVTGVDARGKLGPKGGILGGDVQEWGKRRGVTPLWHVLSSLSPLTPREPAVRSPPSPPSHDTHSPKCNSLQPRRSGWNVLPWFYWKPRPPHPNKCSRDAVDGHVAEGISALCKGWIGQSFFLIKTIT